MIYWSIGIRFDDIFWRIGIRIDGKLDYKDQVRWNTGEYHGSG